MKKALQRGNTSRIMFQVDSTKDQCPFYNKFAIICKGFLEVLLMKQPWRAECSAEGVNSPVVRLPKFWSSPRGELINLPRPPAPSASMSPAKPFHATADGNVRLRPILELSCVAIAQCKTQWLPPPRWRTLSIPNRCRSMLSRPRLFFA